MDVKWANSKDAKDALELVRELQLYFRDQLSAVCSEGQFRPIEWLRDEGRHGGGVRQTYEGGRFFNRASLNVSQVHYDDDASRPLGSATAISSIVHPDHPLLPSIHLHISWTEAKAGGGYWRIMADLNPAIADAEDKANFLEAMRKSSGTLFDYGVEQGERYFHIPALQRYRGVAHFYLEQFNSGNREADRDLAHRFGRSMIEAYAAILGAKGAKLGMPTQAQREQQLAYHTLYFFQVLTLDRGTTSGLLVHDQNDLGILGSLPARVSRDLLASWLPLVPKPQEELLTALVAALPPDGAVEDAQKLALCAAVRHHYRQHPKALDLQARADVVPLTLANHGMS